MESMQVQRSDYVASLDQLFTVSSILSGFAFSGLISLPGMDPDLFGKLAKYSLGSFDLGFYYSFYALFLSTLCFLCTIMTILVYKASNYTIPINKLRRVYLAGNLIFSMAIAFLLVAVVIFALPNSVGFWIANLLGLGIAACFVWENMVPYQKQKRQQQLLSEDKMLGKK